MAKSLLVCFDRIPQEASVSQINTQGIGNVKALIKSVGWFYFFAGWTDTKGLFIVYPIQKHAKQAKELIPRYVAWKAVEKVCSKPQQLLLFHRLRSNINPYL